MRRTSTAGASIAPVLVPASTMPFATVTTNAGCGVSRCAAYPSSMSEPATVLTGYEDDGERGVRRWRRSVLLEHGVPYLEARLLSESEADLHQMVDYLKRGVPPAMLMRIVL